MGTKLLIRFNGDVYQVESELDLKSPTDHLPPTGLKFHVGDILFICYYGGAADAVGPTWRGLGSWSLDYITPGTGISDFFVESVNDDIFNDGKGEPQAYMLADAVADAFDIMNRDGSSPQWLVDYAQSIIDQWRQSNG